MTLLLSVEGPGGIEGVIHLFLGGTDLQKLRRIIQRVPDRPCAAIGDENQRERRQLSTPLKTGAPIHTQVTFAEVKACLSCHLPRKALVGTFISPLGMSLRERFLAGVVGSELSQLKTQQP